MGRDAWRDVEMCNMLKDRKIASLNEMKRQLRTDATMTVFRTLHRLGYVSSYSHRGGYYTLSEIPEYDDLGLWSHGEVHFSRHGNLLRTAKTLVGEAAAGRTAAELAAMLHVEAKHPLLRLARRGELTREVMHGSHVYFSSEADRRIRQRLMRNQYESTTVLGAGLAPGRLSDELKAAIVLFYSLLDERQRRLYAGLEAAKLGRGGTRKIAALLGLDTHTVAKGRQELFNGQVDRERIRNPGAGRKAVEKKLQSCRQDRGNHETSDSGRPDQRPQVDSEVHHQDICRAGQERHFRQRRHSWQIA